MTVGGGTSESGSTRDLVIDRRRHRRMRRDAVLEVMATSVGLRRLRIGGFVVGLVAALFAGWPGLAAIGGWVAVQALWWWWQAGRALREGLAVGQRVLVERGADGSLRVTDETGHIEVARGAALAASRWRGNVSVYLPGASFMLPGELLDDEDVVRALDDADPPSTAGGGGADGAAVVVDTAMQRRLVGVATRLVVTSADFLFVPVAAVVSVVALAVAGVGWNTATAVFALLCLVGVALPLEGLALMRRVVGATYLPGRQLRLTTDDDGFVLTARGVTRTHPWTDYRALRLTDDLVLLRRRRRPLARTVTEVYPGELFDEAARCRMGAAVPRRF